MRITEIRADTLTIGPTIVRVFTDAGLVGLSELGWQDPAIFAAHLDRLIRPQLVGHDPLMPGRHHLRHAGCPEELRPPAGDDALLCVRVTPQFARAVASGARDAFACTVVFTL